MEQTSKRTQPHTDPNADALVSIVIPVYRAEPYLKQCAESLLKQTHRNLELIFVDDGSPDNCPAMLDAYAERDARVCVIHQENCGVSAARSVGIDAAHGDYIGFVDADDWTEPEYAARLLRIFSEHPETDIAVCGWYIHDRPDGKTSGGTDGADRLLPPRDALFYAVDLGRSYEGYLWNKLFRAEIFRETENGKPRFRSDPSIAVCEDLLLVSEIFASGRSAYFCTDRLYHYRYRENSAVHTYDEKSDTKFIAYERAAALCERFDRKTAATVRLSSMKAALSGLAVAKETKQKTMRKRMRNRVNAWFLPLVFEKEIPIKERIKLIVRFFLPVVSLRLFVRMQRCRNRSES